MLQISFKKFMYVCMSCMHKERVDDVDNETRSNTYNRIPTLVAWQENKDNNKFIIIYNYLR